MNKARTIFLPIEIKVREFHSKMLFALFAAERGYETILGGQIELMERMHRLGRGIYIDKSTAVTKREWFRRLRALGNQVAAWDEEGLVYLSDEVYHITRMDPEAFALTDLFFAWGPHHARTVLAGYPDAGPRVVEAGNPRMDLLRPEFRGYCDASVARLRERYGRMILMNTNFPLHNFAKGREAAAKIFDPYPLREKAGLLEEWFAFQRKGYEAFQAAALALMDRFPEHTVVVRPCPAEDLAPWQRLFEGRTRGVVSKEGNVVEWIRASDAVIQFNCTTGVETYLLGVPSIAYRCARSELLETGLVIACSREAFTQDELLSEVERAVARTAAGQPPEPPGPEAQRIIADYLVSTGGATSCERILDELDRRALTVRPFTLPPVPLIKRAWRVWLSVVRRPDPSDIRWYREKFPGLALEEARTVAADFARATGRFGGVRVTSAGKHLVRISPS